MLWTAPAAETRAVSPTATAHRTVRAFAKVFVRNVYSAGERNFSVYGGYFSVVAEIEPRVGQGRELMRKTADRALFRRGARCGRKGYNSAYTRQKIRLRAIESERRIP